MYLVILDDNEPVAQFLASVGRGCNWRVDTVSNGTDFQALIAASPPDAIMLDLQLGSSDGVEQLHFLRELGFRGAIILMSGFDARVLASAGDIGASLGLSIVGVLEKPAPVARVRALLDAIARGGAAPAVATAAVEPAGEALTAAAVARAMDAGWLELHLQPIVTARHHVVAAAEALVRCRDPMLGLVEPDRFIAAAEENPEVIDRLTMWVAETGAAQYSKLAATGRDIRICINVSGRSLGSLDFADRMAAVLERGAVPQGAIGLEITESVATHDLDATASVLTRLRLKGFPLAIDDFGTGHSSLTTLRRLPFSTIKIDKSFVSELETSSDSLTIVRAVIGLAHDLHLTSVAEGVTSADVADRLADLGIDCLQGYHFSGPLPFDGFMAWLRDWAPNHAVP